MKSIYKDFGHRAHLKVARMEGLSLKQYLAKLSRWEREGILTVTARNPDGSPRDFEVQVDLSVMP